MRCRTGDAGCWSKADEDHLLRETAAEIDAAAAAYLAMPPQAPEAIFDHTFAALPAALAGQRAALLDRIAGAAARSAP